MIIIQKLNQQNNCIFSNLMRIDELKKSTLILISILRMTSTDTGFFLLETFFLFNDILTSSFYMVALIENDENLANFLSSSLDDLNFDA